MRGKFGVCSPSLVRTVPVLSGSKCSVYKGRNWYARNVRKTMPALEYHSGVEAALDAAGLNDA